VSRVTLVRNQIKIADQGRVWLNAYDVTTPGCIEGSLQISTDRHIDGLARRRRCRFRRVNASLRQRSWSILGAKYRMIPRLAVRVIGSRNSSGWENQCDPPDGRKHKGNETHRTHLLESLL
jgi:hypothetical protein